VRNTLLEIGGWLKQNGEAIYDTTPWTVYGEGPTKIQPGFGHDKDTKPYTAEDFRFTRKANALYAIEMAWPENGRAVIHALGAAQQAKGLQIKNIELIGGAEPGSTEKVEWHQSNDGVQAQLPAVAPGKYAYVLKVTLGP
jgi:alpha-L-fucosidase